MVYVNFSSDPPNSIVTVDGKEIVDLVQLFRTTCLDEGIICPLSDMHDNWLITGILGNIWWKLTDTERDLIAVYLIRNYLFFTINYFREGKPKCGGGEGDWADAKCLPNGIIRYLRFANSAQFYNTVSMFYWTRFKSDEYCYFEECFFLPVKIVSVSGINVGHCFCGFQIGENMEAFSSWRFFQYRSDDITPGHRQMPCGTEGEHTIVSIREPLFLSSSGYESYPLVEWEIGSNCEIN